MSVRAGITTKNNPDFSLFGIQTISEPIIITAAQHGIAVQKLCPNASAVVRQLQDAGYESYIVGGSVRDLLVGKLPKDFDVATAATPEQVQKVFPRCRLIGRRFRLAHVRMKGSLIEVATFRGAASDGDGGVVHHGDGRILRDNVFGSVEEDAIRRDFTINALFLDPTSGEIRDWVGGYEDLQERRLRLIGDPVTRYREDPVRLLRAARFEAKLGVTPHPETEAPIRELAHLLSDVPPARLFEEVNKLFLTGHAMRSMEALQRFGLSGTLFPPMAEGRQDGKVNIGSLLRQALINTDQRVREDKPVTPAFLFAALLWRPVRERAEGHEADGEPPAMALNLAADEVLAAQLASTMIPRRFSAVTRHIWTMQPRFARTRGKRARRLLSDRRFRAGYDFLLLRVEEDPQLAELAEFWTQAQEDMPPDSSPNRRRNNRRPRKRRSRSQGAGANP